MKNNKKLSIVCILFTILMTAAFLTGCVVDEIPETATPDGGFRTSETDATVTATSSETASSEAATEKNSSAISETQKDGTKATEANTGKTTTTSPTEKNSNNTGNNNSTSSKPNSGSTGSGSSTSSKPSGGSNSGNSGSGSGSSGNSGGNSSTSSKPNGNSNSGGSGSSASSKTWHEAEYRYVDHPAEYKDVWVVDQEAYSYEEPVYETQYKTICNQCGADITNNIDAHMIPNWETCWSYSVKPVKVQTGTRTVNVPEKGHWEKQKVKDAWTEEILVREAGYY